MKATLQPGSRAARASNRPGLADETGVGPGDRGPHHQRPGQCTSEREVATDHRDVVAPDPCSHEPPQPAAWKEKSTTRVQRVLAGRCVTLVAGPGLRAPHWRADGHDQGMPEGGSGLFEQAIRLPGAVAQTLDDGRQTVGDLHDQSLDPLVDGHRQGHACEGSSRCRKRTHEGPTERDAAQVRVEIRAPRQNAAGK